MTAKTEIPMALRAAYLALHRRSEARFAEYGVTADKFVLLATLALGRSLTQRELARWMPSDPSTVRAMLVLLEKQGLIQRGADPSDARARTVVLSAAGMRKLRQLWKAGESIRATMFESIQPGEAEVLVRLRTQVAESLQGQSVATGVWIQDKHKGMDHEESYRCRCDMDYVRVCHCANSGGTGRAKVSRTAGRL